MRPYLSRLRKFTDHPATRLVMGLILIVSSVAEGYDTFFDDIHHFRLRAHHGLFFFGLANILASVPDLIEGLEKAMDVLTVQREIAAEELQARAEVQPESVDG